MNRHQRHVDDDRLFASYLARRDGEPTDADVSCHLAGCPTCTTRFRELGQLFDDLRNHAEREVEAAFPPERLQRQRQHLVRRLEHLGHAARVISFPGRPASRAVGSHGGRAAPRWIAAAAAAGLFVGAAVGTFYHGTWHPLANQSPAARSSPARTTPATTRDTATLASNTRLSDDDTFLSEMELAVGGTRCRELRTFDALTPSVRDVRVARIAF